jgi:hypothetical protein
VSAFGNLLAGPAAGFDAGEAFGDAALAVARFAAVFPVAGFAAIPAAGVATGFALAFAGTAAGFGLAEAAALADAAFSLSGPAADFAAALAFAGAVVFVAFATRASLCRSHSLHASCAPLD